MPSWRVSRARCRWPGPGHRVGELVEQGHAPDDPVQGLAGLLPVLGEQPELPVRQGHAGPVAEFFVDGEGFAVPVLGLVQPPAVLGGHAELVVGGRHAGPVAEFFVDGEGFAVPVVGLVQPPAVLGRCMPSWW